LEILSPKGYIQHKARAFLYGKISNSKIEESCSLKNCGHSLETTFVLPLFKTLSADGRASASIVEKKAKKVEIFQYFGDFFKSRMLVLFLRVL
jgi:hypothetical protein